MTHQIDFFGEIGWELTGRYLKRELDSLGSADTAMLLVHSPGGSVFEGNFIHSIIQRTQCRVEADIVGLCASMATVIVSGCAKVTMSRNATFMVHQPSSWAGGNAEDMEEEAKLLRMLEGIMLENYSRKTGQTVEALRTKYFDGKDHWLTAEQALAEGFVDAVTEDRFVRPVPDGFAAFALEQRRAFYRHAAISTTSTKPAMKDEPVSTTAPQPAAPAPAPELVASLNRDVERFKAAVAEKDAAIEALNREKDQILESNAESVVEKDNQIKALTTDNSRLSAEKQGLAAQVESLRLDNEMNLALASLAGSNGKPIGMELVKEIRANFRAQHRLEQESGELKIFSIAKNAYVEAPLAKAVTDYAYAQHYVTLPQTGTGIPPRQGQNAYAPNYEGEKEMQIKWAKAKAELHEARVAEFSDGWYKALHAVGYPVPAHVRERLNLN